MRPIQRFGLLLFSLAFLALFAILGLAQGIGSPSVPAGSVAVVEGLPGDSGQITDAQFRAALTQVIAEGGGGRALPGSEAYEQAKAEAMGRLLKASWVGGEAAARGISVSAAQVSAAIAAFKQRQRFGTAAQFERFLSASRLTLAEFKLLARLQLLSGALQEEVMEAPPAPSDSEVSDYYEAAKALQFTTAPTYDIRLILNTDRAQVARVRAELGRDDSAASWARLARRYSEDPTGKGHGGLHRDIPAEFGEPLDAAIAAAPIGELQGPLEAKGAYFVFVVEGSEPGRVEPLSEVRLNVLSALAKQEREEALAVFAREFEAKWSSRTFCASGFEVEGCSNYRGSGHPPNAPSACFEAHPKAGIEAPSCPAPVAQSVPAMPGTVSILSPKGTALPQRPLPVGG